MEEDLLTRLRLFNLSFVLRNMLPAPRITRNPQSMAAHQTTNQVEKARLEIEGHHDTQERNLLFSGSSMQTLNMPSYYPMPLDKSAIPEPIDSADVDLMVVFGTARDMRIESGCSNLHPGYVRLQCTLGNLPEGLKVLGPMVLVKRGSKTYLSSKVVVQTVAICRAFHKDKVSIEDLVDSVDGQPERLAQYFNPDGTVRLEALGDCLLRKPHNQDEPQRNSDNEEVDGTTSCSSSKLLEVKISGPSASLWLGKTSHDTVPAIVSSAWPDQAQEWLTRKRPSGWPSDSAVKKIAAQGCHVVPTAHKKSGDPNIEWRVSFSNAENELAESLNGVQRQCFILLKALQTDLLDPPRKVITSYHLKTVLFWLLERYPSEQCTAMKAGQFFLTLLDHFLHCLSKHNIPNYFLPENNMLTHVHRDFIHQMAKKVSTLRKDPLKYLFQFNRRVLFVFSPEKPWEELFSPVTCFAGKTVKESCETQLESLLLFLEFYLKGGLPDRKIVHDSILDIAMEVVPLKYALRDQSPPSLQEGYLLAAMDMSEFNVDLSIYFSAYVMQRFFNDPGMLTRVAARANETMEKKEVEQLADKAFRNMPESNKFILQKLEYARFLITLGREQEAEDILLRIISENADNPPAAQNLYSRANFSSMNSDENPSALRVNVVGFACHVLVKLYFHQKENVKAIRVTQLLVKVARRLPQDQFPMCFLMATDNLLLLGQVDIAVALMKQAGVIQSQP